MTDEEKKALEQLNKRYEFFKENPLATNVWLSLDIYNLGTILNLIDKQSKEIEEIKKLRQILNNVEFGKFSYDKNYQVKIEAGRQQGKSFRAGMEFSNKIWKDKIKAKIEESELLIDNSQGCMSNEDLYKEFGKIEFGKSLLERSRYDKERKTRNRRNNRKIRS